MNEAKGRVPGPRPRRRARRVAEVDYDRTADAPGSANAPSGRWRGGDAERAVILDEGEAAPLDPLEYLENERPPHYGGD
ncbi:hypothetical protein [Corynebacterium sp. UBA2622]|uniref:hypothetical protein n=1 Tax=Corynebacterium sp. UBA2622 TaxID=1946393 RepID=UPI0025BD64F6|nr:hypothetical protein [Corynebacterium sp. UBA2622]